MTIGTRLAAQLACLTMATISPVWCSTMSRVDYSFEDAVRSADIIVVGRVLESPGAAALRGNLGMKHLIGVEQYIKGRGPSELSLLTFNGCFEAQVKGNTEIQCVTGMPEPTVPDVGTVAVFFISGQRFAPYGPGFLRIEEDPGSGERYIQVSIRWHELLDEGGVRAYEEFQRNLPLDSSHLQLMEYWHWIQKVRPEELTKFVHQIEAIEARRIQERINLDVP
jgi:hypothetical protein